MGNPKNAAAALRRQAEAIALKKAALPAKALEQPLPEDPQLIIHELRVQQIELELQNEELRRVQLELEALQERYFDFYNLAPVGYLTLNASGLITEANLTAANLMGVPRSALVQQPISLYISREHQGLYHRHHSLLNGGAPQSFELKLLNKQGSAFWAHLRATPGLMPDGAPGCRIVLSDISERKQAEEAMRDSQSKYRLLADNASDMISLHDKDGAYTYVSPACRALLGYEPEELLGRNPYDLFHPEDVPKVQASQASVLAGQPFTLEYRLQKKDGTYAWLETNNKTFLDGSGHVVQGIVCVTRHINQRKRAEVELREALQFNEQIIQSAGEGIIVYGPDLHFQVWNPFMETLTGLPASEVVGKHPLDYFPFLQDSGVMERLERALAGEAVSSVDFQFDIPQTGKSGWATDMSGPFRNAKGEIIGAIGVVVDITERKQAVDALRESNDLLSLFVRLSPIYAYIKAVTPTESRVLQASDNFLQMVGIRGSDMIGKTMPELFPADLAAKMTADDWSVVLSGKVQEFDEEFNGRSYTTLKFPILLGGKTLLAGFTIDLTDRKQAEEDRRRLQAHLQQAQKMESLGSLAGGVAHDMNNVLAAILGLASLHLEMQPIGSPAHLAFETISEAATRGGKMVKSLLSFARQNPTEERVLNLNAILAEEVRLLEHTTLAKVHLEMDFDPNLRPILGDAGALTHAFMNLCINAVDALSETGTLTLRTRNIDESWIEVTVEDTGSGMTKEVLDRSLEPFFTTKAVGKGTGLGLSMVYSIVKAHHGVIDLRSELGQGTTVQMRFPACHPSPNLLEAESQALNEAPPTQLNILLVDDDALVLSTLKLLLEAQGHTLTLAASGEEAVEQLKAGLPVEVVILDLSMPGIGGEGALPLIRALRPSVPVLLATGRVEQVALDLVHAHPHVTILPKPFALGELRWHLEHLT